MLSRIVFLVAIFQLLINQAAFSADYHMDFLRYGNSGSSGGGQGSGTDLSHLFRESPEVKRLQARAHEIDAITASIKSTDQRISIKRAAIKRLKGIAKRRNSVRKQVKHMDHAVIRTGYVNIATSSIAVSRDFYIANEPENGMIAANIAETALDLATSFTPGVSWGRDFYEALSGKDMISGNSLSSLDRGMAVLGSVTMGMGSKLGKVFKVFRKLLKGRKASSSVDIAERAVKLAEKERISSSKFADFVGRLRSAGRKQGDFDIPSGTKKEAFFLGEIWVGKSAKKIPYRNNPGKYIYESKDGSKLFREPVRKRDGRTLANFEWRYGNSGKWIGNGHMPVN